MLSKERLELYRRMTPSERLSLTFKLMRENWPYMFHGTPDVVDRRFELLRRENDLRNQGILRALARSQDRG